MLEVIVGVRLLLESSSCFRVYILYYCIEYCDYMYRSVLILML